MVDVDALRSARSEAEKRLQAATPGSKDHAEATIESEVYKILGQSLKVA